MDFLYFEIRLTVRRISCGVLGGFPLTWAFVLPNAILAAGTGSDLPPLHQNINTAKRKQEPLLALVPTCYGIAFFILPARGIVNYMHDSPKNSPNHHSFDNISRLQLFVKTY